MNEIRCPSCKKVLLEGEVIGNIDIYCINSNCGYNRKFKKKIHFEFYPHVWELFVEYSKAHRS